MWWKNFHACTHGLKQGGGGEGGVVLGGVAAKNYQLPSAKQWGKTGQVGVGGGAGAGVAHAHKTYSRCVNRLRFGSVPKVPHGVRRITCA